jgi:hypothetical protein
MKKPGIVKDHFAAWRLPHWTVASLVAISIVVDLAILLGWISDRPYGIGVVGLIISAMAGVLVSSSAEAARHRRKVTTELSDMKRSVIDLVDNKAPLHLNPSFIRPELDQHLRHPRCDSWKFRGGSGRWQRTSVLPTLAKQRNFDVKYSMLILDPRDEQLCRDYAAYRNGHRRDEVQETSASIRMDLLACIIAVAWYRAKSRIRPEIHLNTVYSPLRLDLSPFGAVLTVSDPHSPALSCGPDSWLYTSLQDEFDRTLEQTPSLTLPVELIHRLQLSQNLDSNLTRAILLETTMSDGTPFLKELDLDTVDLNALAELAGVCQDEGTRVICT